MAKKKKQKKASLSKKRGNKELKRREHKKKLLAKKPVQKKMTMSKVKKSLKNMASLVFEPELKEMAFSPEEVARVVEAHDKVPDRIEAICDEGYIEKLLENIKKLEERCEAEQETNKLIMIQAITYYMTQEKAPVYMNQVIVAMYLRAEAKHFDKPDLDSLDLLNQELREYDKTWKEVLEEKFQKVMEEKALQAQEDGVEEEAEEADEEPVDLGSAFEEIEEELDAYLAESSGLSEDAQERVKEDSQVLLEDYFEEKSIETLSDLKPRRVANFLESWFVRTMNPTKEDLACMFDSLGVFFQFAAQSNKIDEETHAKIKETLAKKDEILESTGL